jgi:glycerol uptake facilitator-like aquaporin
LTAFSFREAAAETLGAGLLVATIVGSGIMAERLSGGNAAMALLCNAIPTGAMLTVLILLLGPVSGAHLNPAVSAASWLRGSALGKAPWFSPWRKSVAPSAAPSSRT